MISRKKLLRWLRREERFYREGHAAGRLNVFAGDRANMLIAVIGKVERMRKARSKKKRVRRGKRQ